MASRANNNYYNAYFKANVTLSRVHARLQCKLPVSRIVPARDAGMVTLSDVKVSFQAKPCQNLSDHALLNIVTPFFVFSVLLLILTSFRRVFGNT